MVKSHLNPDGVMVVNMNMRGQEEGNINEYLSDTIASVFGEVYTIDVDGSTNRELYASDNPEMMAALSENVKLEKHEDLAEFINGNLNNFAKYSAGNCIMSDDKAPVELLGMQIIDDLIGDEITYYKKIYKEQGIQGLLNEF